MIKYIIDSYGERAIRFTAGGPNIYKVGGVFGRLRVDGMPYVMRPEFRQVADDVIIDNYMWLAHYDDFLQTEDAEVVYEYWKSDCDKLRKNGGSDELCERFMNAFETNVKNLNEHGLDAKTIYFRDAVDAFSKVFDSFVDSGLDLSHDWKGDFVELLHKKIC